jgi:hypothetical protein
MGYWDGDRSVHGDWIRFRDLNADGMRYGDRVRPRDRDGIRRRYGHWDRSVDRDWDGVRYRDRDLLCYSSHTDWTHGGSKSYTTGSETNSS